MLINFDYKYKQNEILINNTTVFLLIYAFSQSGVIKGFNYATNNETTPFANVYIEQTQSGVASDLDGNCIISTNPNL